MTDFVATFKVESFKLRRSKMLWCVLLFFTFIATLRTGASDWTSYLGDITYIIAMLGAVGFGFVTSWVFGREYTDRTLKDLLVLPISRLNIVLAKYMAVGFWCMLITFIVFLYGMILGRLANIPGFSIEITMQIFIFLFVVVSVFNLLLCAPVAFLASYSRGYLAPIGFAIAAFVTVQAIGGNSSMGAYFPWAIPQLHVISTGSEAVSLGWINYGVLYLTALLSLLATLAWWRFADQD